MDRDPSQGLYGLAPALKDIFYFRAELEARQHKPTVEKRFVEQPYRFNASHYQPHTQHK